MKLENMSDIETRINAALNEIRPYLQADGGDISLLEVTDDNRVVVELHGACSSCNMSFMTMRAGVEEAIKSAAPQIVEVVAVNHLNQQATVNWELNIPVRILLLSAGDRNHLN